MEALLKSILSWAIHFGLIGEAQKIKLTIKKVRYLFIIKVSYINYLIITKYPIPSNLG